jgi:tripartite-type tricarboxylate transporter receptor subunit TctC
LRYAANAAPRDGTVISLPHVIIFQDGLLNPRAQFDPTGFQWIGRLTSQLQVGVVSAKSKVTALVGAKTIELIAGGTTANNPTALNARILNALAGTRFKIVTGYKGTHEVAIAWERGEVDVLTVSWDLIKTRYGDKLGAGLAFPLYANAARRPPELAHVPLMTDFGRTEGDKAFLKIYAIGAEIGRSLAAPSGVPQDRVNEWRVALQKMLNDPEFRQAVAKGNIRLDPLTGEQLTASAGSVAKIPAGTIAKAREFYERLLAEVR